MLPVGESGNSVHEMLRRLIFVFAAASLLAACTAAPTASAISLTPGNFTALGVNPKSANPGPSDLGALHAAEAGTLQQPAFVEFYGDT